MAETGGLLMQPLPLPWKQRMQFKVACMHNVVLMVSTKPGSCGAHSFWKGRNGVMGRVENPLVVGLVFPLTLLCMMRQSEPCFEGQEQNSRVPCCPEQFCG